MLPGWGGMAVLDRTWYGRVLVERVEGFAAEEAWQRAYGEIVEFETTLAAEGMILVKFWMHVSPEEQLRRFEARADDPLQGVEADRRGLAQPGEARRVRGGRRGHARAHRPSGRARGTSSPAEDKRWARVDVVRTVCAAIEAALTARGHRPDPPLVRRDRGPPVRHRPC